VVKVFFYGKRRAKMNGLRTMALIVSPFSGGGILKLFSTHPPIEERIERLKSIKPGA
jgi:heat shock protein HtpX